MKLRFAAILMLCACSKLEGQITPPGSQSTQMMPPQTSYAQGFDINIGPFYVPPDQEVQTCFYLKVPSDMDLDLGKVTINFAQGTHHMHVYYGDEQHDDGSEECFQSVNFDVWHLLVGAQKPHLEWELPPGIAFHVKARQQLLVQVHFVNAGTLKTTDNMAQGTIHFDGRKSEDVIGYMGSIFGQQRDIDIQPHSSLSVDGICPMPHEVSIGALAGHYHFKGEDFTASRMNEDGTAQPAFYTTSDFAEPAFDLYGEDHPLRFHANERILWHCDYLNSTDDEVLFGPRELTQEHCNMFGFFYPARAQQEFIACPRYGRCDHECAATETCNVQGQCVPSGSCTPMCAGLACGNDGCGGTCGDCASGQMCTAGTCTSVQCTPKCSGLACGNDGCGGSCGACPSGQSCSGQGQCVTACVPACNGLQCGDDGCGGSCGTCASGQGCNAQKQCAPVCAPKCGGVQCGDDSCGGSCGQCGANLMCNPSGQCVAPVVPCAQTGGLESEPNDTFASTSTVCGSTNDGAVATGSISQAGDLDWYTFTLQPGQAYSVTLSGMPADYTFTIFHAATSGLSNIRSAVDNHDMADQTVSTTTVNGGTYYVKVFSPTSAFSSMPYHLTIKSTAQ